LEPGTALALVLAQVQDMEQAPDEELVQAQALEPGQVQVQDVEQDMVQV